MRQARAGRHALGHVEVAEPPESVVATANDLLGLLGLIGVVPTTRDERMNYQVTERINKPLVDVALEHGIADEMLTRLRKNPPYSGLVRALERNGNGGSR